MLGRLFIFATVLCLAIILGIAVYSHTHSVKFDRIDLGGGWGFLVNSTEVVPYHNNRKRKRG